MIKFLKRKNTDSIRHVFRPEYAEVSVYDLTKMFLRMGKLNFGYHYVLRNGGLLEKGLDNEYFGDYEIAGYKTAICIMVTSEHLTDAQKITLDNLQKKLSLPIKD